MVLSSSTAARTPWSSMCVEPRTSAKVTLSRCRRQDGARCATSSLQVQVAVVGTRRFGGPSVDSIELKEFQELLAIRRKELLAEAQRSASGMTTTKDNFPDPTD